MTEIAALRRRVAQACRVLGVLELTLATLGHASARLPGSNRSRSSHPDPAQSMLEQNGRDCRRRHGFQRIHDVA